MFSGPSKEDSFFTSSKPSIFVGMRAVKLRGSVSTKGGEVNMLGYQNFPVMKLPKKNAARAFNNKNHSKRL